MEYYDVPIDITGTVWYRVAAKDGDEAVRLADDYVKRATDAELKAKLDIVDINVFDDPQPAEYLGWGGKA